MKDIAGFEGLYAVTSCGKVWSYRRKKFLKPGNNGVGYLFVTLCKNGKKKQFYIHRLVAEAYIPNPDNLPQVNHLNEDKTANYISNLSWCSAKENSNYGTRTERSAKARSKPVYCVELGKTFESASKAERELGLSKHITSCCKGTRNICGGYHWRYAESEAEAV